MNFRLTARLEDYFEYNGKVFHLDLAFDNVLRIFELFNDPLFHVFEKIDIALEMLIHEYEGIKDLEIKTKNSMLLSIFKRFLGIDLEKQNDPMEKKIFDLEKDSGIVFASFLHVYGMDLLEQRGRLHWIKFVQLLQNIDNSKLNEVIGIRQMKIPEQQKGNEEYRKQILKMKQLYSLEQDITEEQAQQKINKVFDALANTFKK